MTSYFFIFLFFNPTLPCLPFYFMQLSYLCFCLWTINVWNRAGAARWIHYVPVTMEMQVPSLKVMLYLEFCQGHTCTHIHTKCVFAGIIKKTSMTAIHFLTPTCLTFDLLNFNLQSQCFTVTLPFVFSSFTSPSCHLSLSPFFLKSLTVSICSLIPSWRVANKVR